ncbi:hypothetical protein [Flavobacterium sp. MDT1-60]|uniref:hypothetical protein n=1 Tax=Flavobacterium sp. MDT1-60 TaxID=1979344 RepID=UPI001CE10BA4|nr:hypothetical protein [Flavobacterium sp. MDT1-60]
MALSKTKKVVFSILIVLLITASFLFWPINTDGTLIKPNEKLVEGKAAFLAQKDTSKTAEKNRISLYYWLMI